MPVKKIGISISPETYKAAEDAVAAGRFRNISHVFEEGARKVLRKELSEKSENPCEALA
jgi:Arc/MetJ-type ribon-helix-helix transcriptional regulator